MEKAKVFRDTAGRIITTEDIKDGLWITTEDGVQHGLHDTIPRECKECGFSAMEIISKDFKRQILTLGCPWCHARRELCLICGKMEYLLKHTHRKYPKILSQAETSNIEIQKEVEVQ